MSLELKKIAQGSAKDLYLMAGREDLLYLKFSDRISVFDYGALPDLIEGRGQALCRFAKEIFKKLEASGFETAYDSKESANFEDHVVLKRAEHPKFAFQSSLKFLPLEIVFRWGAPEGSSILKRRPELVKGQSFKEAEIEFFTKLEAYDRLLDEKEAASLAGGFDKLSALKTYTAKLALCLKNILGDVGLKLWDGKIECAWDESKKTFILVDAITPDELRLEDQRFPEIPLSKELLRLWLAKTSWAASIRRAKAEKGEAWREDVSSPFSLGRWRLQVLKGLYNALADQIQTKSKNAIGEFVQSLPAPKVCVLGGGGRESAMRYRLGLEGCVLTDDPEQADTVWVSLDSDLEAGRVNEFEKKGKWVWGATREASQLEWSKKFGREVAKAAGITVPRFEVGLEGLKNFSRNQKPPVVKLDSLAAGKGVIVPHDWAECERAAQELSRRGPILFEEQLEGMECSAFFMIQSGYQKTEALFLGTAKDFKRRYAGDKGPNTGGMGAYSPHPDLGAADLTLFENWAERICQELERRKLSYNGVLYFGLMKDKNSGWNLIEFNARLGDPETQSLVCTWEEKLPLLRSCLGLSIGAIPKTLFKRVQALCLALVRQEYPQKAADNFKLPDWKFTSAPQGNCHLFLSASQTGRVAYLVGIGRDLFEAGDEVFKTWVESPWKSYLDWRADILP